MRPSVVVVVGTRPEAIKMAPVVRSLRSDWPEVETVLVTTGQHADLVRQALRPFDLEPDHDLGIMEPGQDLWGVAIRSMERLQPLLEELSPDLLLVQGDTASVFFGALGGFFHRVPVGHVEAGLRSGDMDRPFPEEGFRRLVSVLARFHFAPTPDARSHLLDEGVPHARIHVTGNPVVDALRTVEAARLPIADPVLKKLVARVEKGSHTLALLTAHRRESFGAPLEAVFRGVVDLVDAAPDLHVLYPVHPNPAVLGPARETLGTHPRIHLVDPLGYPDLVRALATASLVLTDSGGIQEEAPSFGTPVLVLRDVTERPEGIRAGVASLVGTDPQQIRQEGLKLLAEGDVHRDRRRGANPYGDGHAGSRIARIVAESLTQEALAP